MVTMLRMVTVFTLGTLATVFKMVNVLRMITVFTVGTLVMCSLSSPLSCVHCRHVFTLDTCLLLPPLPHMITLVKCVSQKNVRNKLDKQQTPCYSHQPPQGADIKLPPPPTHTNNNKQEACVEVGKKRTKTA